MNRSISVHQHDDCVSVMADTSEGVRANCSSWHLTFGEAEMLERMLRENREAREASFRTAWGIIETPVYRVDHGDLLSASAAMGAGQ